MSFLFWALPSLDIPDSNRTNYGEKTQDKANPRSNNHPWIYHKLFIFQIISPLSCPDWVILHRGDLAIHFKSAGIEDYRKTQLLMLPIPNILLLLNTTLTSVTTNDDGRYALLIIMNNVWIQLNGGSIWLAYFGFPIPLITFGHMRRPRYCSVTTYCRSYYGLRDRIVKSHSSSWAYPPHFRVMSYKMSFEKQNANSRLSYPSYFQGSDHQLLITPRRATSPAKIS